MKKIFWVFFVSLIILTFTPVVINAGGAGGGWDETPSMPLCGPNGDQQATGLVPCGVSCQCTIENFFLMLVRIYNFFVWWVATPLATLMLIIGAILIMISAGNPNLASLGKKTLYAAVIGLVLVFGAWVIINFILTALGYGGNWSVL